MSEKYGYIIRLKASPWYLSFLERFQYQVEYLPISSVYSDSDKWKIYYELYKTQEEAQEGIVRLWAIHSHPVFVYLCGICFSRKAITYRQEWASKNGVSFWSR